MYHGVSLDDKESNTTSKEMISSQHHLTICEMRNSVVHCIENSTTSPPDNNSEKINNVNDQVTLCAAIVVMARVVFLTMAAFLCKSSWFDEGKYTQEEIINLREQDGVQENGFQVVKHEEVRVKF